MHTASLDAQVHHAFIDRLRQTGRAPSRHEVSVALAKPVEDIEKALSRLAESHGVVLHPHGTSPTRGFGANDMEFLPDRLFRSPRFRILGGNGMPIIATETGASGR